MRSPAKRILFVTWGSLGDLHPYMALARELQRRGHRPAIATLGAFRQVVEQAGIVHHAIRPDVDATDREQYRTLVRRLLDARDGPRYLFLEVFKPTLRQTYDDTLAAIRAEGGVDLVVSHQVPVTTPIVAEQIRARWASGVLLPMAFLSDYDPPTAPQAPWLQPIAARHRMLARAINRLGRRVTEPWVAPVHAFRRELGLPPGRNPVFEGQHSPDLVLALFSKVLAEMQPDYPTQTRITGFAFHDGAAERPPSPELARFIEAGDPPIVFTLGSSAVWIAEDFYPTAIEVTTRLKRRAVLLAGDAADALRTQAPASVAVTDYAPHGFVMPRACAVVHQGGVGTTGQALRAGRPMLVIPYGQDQPDNARRCVRLGVSRILDRHKCTPSGLAAELNALLSEPSYTAAAARVGALVREERGTEEACDAIECLLGERLVY